jgi:N-acetylmuramoyl-L-alanine amidase
MSKPTARIQFRGTGSGRQKVLVLPNGSSVVEPSVFWPRCLVVHHSQSPDGPALDAAEIRGWHLANGWADVGYHALAEHVGTAARRQLIFGRPFDLEGAHVKGYNRIALGLCVVGNFETQAPDSELYPWLAPYVRALLVRCGIPSGNVFGHGEFVDTTCPGLFDLSKLKALL